MSMLPQLKKKITSFLCEEKGTISKDKLLKGAIVLSGISVVAQQARAQVEQIPKSDDRQGWNDGKGSTIRTAPSGQPGTEVGHVTERWSDGGEKDLQGSFTFPTGGFSLFASCSSVDQVTDSQGKAIPEVRVTTCTPGINLLGGCIASLSGKGVIHKSVDRTWHTNNINLKRDDILKMVEAMHSNHGKHHNANEAKCSDGNDVNSCFPENCLEDVFAGIWRMFK